MNKKLTAKTQKLVPALAEEYDFFSSSIVIEPTEKELLLKKGNVYTVFDIKSPTYLNVNLVSNVINDVLYDHYYNSENISPVQSLEKAILNINDKVTSLSAQQHKKSENVTEFEFNIVAGVLWGNVLYIVQHGSGKSFLMREGEIKEVSSTSEGNFTVASGVIKEDDVIVLSTEEFAKKFPPDKLLGAALSSNDLEPSQSSIILKFLVDADLSQEELIDFNLEDKAKQKKSGSLIERVKNMKSKKEENEQTIESLVGAVKEPEKKGIVSKLNLKKNKEKKPEKPLPQPNSQNLPPINKSGSHNIKVKSRRTPKIKINKNVLLGIVVALLIGSIARSIISANKNKDTAPKNEEKRSTLTKPEEPANNTENMPTEQEELETVEPTVQGSDVEVFYDLKLTEETAQPSEVAVFNNTLVAVDTISGKVYTSALDTPKFTAEETTFAGISSIVNSGGNLGFVDSSGFKVYDLTTSTVEEEYTGSFGVADTYLSNIYSIEGNTLKKYVKSGGSLTESTWATNDDFSGAKAMEIAYSIYVVTQNDNIAVYTQGNKSNFEVSGLEINFTSITDLVTDNNFDYIYIADAGNRRVVMLDTDGNFMNEIIPNQPVVWDSIKDISVSSDEGTLYVLSGTKVYEVDLNNIADNSPKEEAPVTEDTAESAVVETDGTDAETDGTNETVTTDGTETTTP